MNLSFRGRLGSCGKQFLQVIAFVIIICLFVIFLFRFTNDATAECFEDIPLGTIMPGPQSNETVVRNSPRVLCFIITGPKNHKKKASHVKKLWGRRCDKLLIMSTQEDKELGTVALEGVQEGRDWLWAKAKEALKYVWKHHRNDAEWFLKADDDTYVVLENLKNFLAQYNTTKPYYFGCRLQYNKGGPKVNFGGAGYVLSQETLRMFIQESLPNPGKCRQEHDGNEDTQLGICLNNVGVYPSDTRDKYGRHRFLHSYPEYHVAWSKKWNAVMDKEKKGLDCCAEDVISFHHVSPNGLYVLESMFYHFKVSKPV